jgi:hypothetical protein
MSYFSRAATTIWHWTCWLGVTLFLVFASLLVTPVLAVWLALGFFPKRKSKPLTSPAPHRRLLQIPLREGSDIFVLNPDGAKVPVSRLEAVTQARAWNDACFGAFVYELPHKD